MLRGLAIWILLIPMLSNGLWIVCGESSETAPTADSLKQSEKDCIRICLMKHAAELGTICMALPGNTKNSASFTVIDLGVAVLPLEFLLRAVDLFVPLVTMSYVPSTSPGLATDTPITTPGSRR